MGKLAIILFVLFLFVLSLFAFANHGVVTVAIPFGPVYEIQKFALILFSMALGVFTAFIFFAIRDTKKFIDNWQYQKKQKQEIKVQALYSKALNSLLAKNEEAAREALEDILKEEPDHIDAILRLGDISAAGDARKTMREHFQRQLPEAEALKLALMSLYNAADDDVGTGGPDLVRGIYPTAKLVNSQGITDVPNDKIRSL